MRGGVAAAAWFRCAARAGCVGRVSGWCSILVHACPLRGCGCRQRLAQVDKIFRKVALQVVRDKVERVSIGAADLVRYTFTLCSARAHLAPPAAGGQPFLVLLVPPRVPALVGLSRRTLRWRRDRRRARAGGWSWRQ